MIDDDTSVAISTFAGSVTQSHMKSGNSGKKRKGSVDHTCSMWVYVGIKIFSWEKFSRAEVSGVLDKSIYGLL